MKQYKTDSQFTAFISEKLAKDFLSSQRKVRFEQKRKKRDYKTAGKFLLFFRQKLIVQLADTMINLEELQEELLQANRK